MQDANQERPEAAMFNVGFWILDVEWAPEVF
jgi:hypothetical protein